MKIVVLAGGISNERNVSLASGAMVARALREKNDVALVDMFLGIEDGLKFEDLSKLDIPVDWINVSKGVPKYEDIIKSRSYKSNSIIGKNVIDICREADLVFWLCMVILVRMVGYRLL